MIKEQWKIYKQEIKEAWKDLQTKGRRARQIPNILTSLRLLAPVFILPASFLGNIPLVLIFVAGFSVTDMMDGAIARKFHFTSKLGKDLDAFCDKVFAGTLLLASSFLNPIMLLSFSLEGVIAGINVSAKLKGLEPKSSYIGKAKTLFLFPLIGFSLVANTPNFELLFKLLFGATTTLQLVTAITYLKKYQMLGEKTIEEKNDSSTILGETVESKSEGKSKKKEKEALKPTQTSQKISMLKEMKTVLLKETSPVDEKKSEKVKENRKK